MVRHKGGTYYLRAKVAGKIVRESLEVQSLRVARMKRDDRLAALRAEAAEGGKGSLGEILEVVARRRIQRPGLRPSTKRYYRRLKKILSETLPIGEAASKWSPDGAREWWESIAGKHSPPQANNLLQWARAVGVELVDRGLLSRNPMNGLKALRVKRSAVEELPDQATVQRILEQMRGQKHATAGESADLCEWIAWTGMRPSEARAVRWEEVMSDRILVTGGDSGTKNHLRRWVPIAQPLRELIERRRQKSGAVFHVSDPRKTFYAALTALKLPQMRLYDLRHVFATHAMESGVDIPTVAKWLGHQDGGVLAMRTYGHIRDDHSLEQVKRLG